MKGKPVPDNDHVSRYVGGSKITRGRITGAAFELRPGEDALSVNWLEYLELHDRNAEIQELRKVFLEKGRTLQPTAKFAVLNVGETRGYIRQESDDNREILFLHDPEEPTDPSHSGIYNIPRDDLVIGNMIAELIKNDEIYPAREPTD